jgi:PhnB protein
MATTAKRAKATPAKAKKAARGAKRPTTKAKAKAKKPAKRKVSAIPPGYHALTPYLIVKNAADAIAFYAKAFGAKEKVRIAMPDGSVMHAEIKIGDSMLMLSEENPGWGAKSPLTLGGNATHLMIYGKDVDAAFARAVAAGCTVTMPVTAMFWGDRYCKVTDPFGHQWSLGTHVEDVGPRELQRRADAEMAKAALQQG